MKQSKSILLIIYLLAFTAYCQVSKNSNLALLSNQTPTDSALIFAPGIVSTNAFEFAITLNPEMDELFFTRRKPEAENEIYTVRLVHGRWSEPEVAFFKAEEGWDFEPHINPQGDRLYFGSLRPLPNATKGTGLHQWYCEKTESGWSNPIPLNGPFIEKTAMYLTSAENGNLYFTSWINENGEFKDEGIYSSINEDGNYKSIHKLGPQVNLKGLKSIAHPYIAPDESFIIFDGKSDISGFGSCDLYISFNKNGTWTEAQNLGPLVNTELCEFTASVSPDGKYLFFHRGLVSDDEEYGNIHWIDFELLKKRIEQRTSHVGAYSSDGEIYLTDMEGTSKVRITNPPQSGGGYLAWSPDGKHLAFYAKYDDKKTWSIHTINGDGTNWKRLTHEKYKWDNSPTWSPDGKRIVFSREYKDSENNRHPEIWIMNSDGSEQSQIKSLRGGGPHFAPDGRIAFHSESENNKSNISIADIDGGNIIQLTNSEAEEQHPEVSPDGKQITFMSDRDGNHEIYVMNIDGSNQKRLTNNDVDDWYPCWSPDGSQIIFGSKTNNDGDWDIYSMNMDGSSIRKIIANSVQSSWVKTANQRLKHRLFDVH
ncbi:TolB family protein [[Muricauda] lutisoli]|uniref:PD40 domain-containing protein n=1 Tax=[Muricauda] lutisoli TaxID=2816035 RepID=A0ABS3F0G1_9FLAO|nr:DUF5050 domain-containing protein [[Muricauda] lutisoli]MBO0331838.1 PD40 domain-containing protein [[Muricauda] lutisoli]